MATTSESDQAAQQYIDGIADEFRPLFDRLHRVVNDVHPEVVLSLSYGMPTFATGSRKLHIGVWKHGVSIYGSQQGEAASIVARHPTLKTSKGTIRIRPEDADGITDAEFADLVRAALDD
jgi:uncharacterized protein YdhG (YjbR/CyaY superfamily)